MFVGAAPRSGPDAFCVGGRHGGTTATAIAHATVSLYLRFALYS